MSRAVSINSLQSWEEYAQATVDKLAAALQAFLKSSTSGERRPNSVMHLVRLAMAIRFSPPLPILSFS